MSRFYNYHTVESVPGSDLREIIESKRSDYRGRSSRHLSPLTTRYDYRDRSPVSRRLSPDPRSSSGSYERRHYSSPSRAYHRRRDSRSPKRGVASPDPCETTSSLYTRPPRNYHFSSTRADYVNEEDERHEKTGRHGRESWSRSRSYSNEPGRRSTESYTQERPASPVSLEDDMRREMERKKKEEELLEQDNRDKAIIAESMEDLEEVDDVVLPEEKEVDAVSLGSLPSVKDDLEKNDDSLLSFEQGSCQEEKVQNSELNIEKPLCSPLGDQSISNRKGGYSREQPYSPVNSSEGNLSPISDEIFVTRRQKRVVKCLVCKSEDHLAKQCPDLVCYKCNEGGHFAKECKNPPAPRKSIQRNQSHNPPAAKAWAEQAQSVDEIASSTPSTFPMCFKCQTVGHKIRDCPSLDCKKCGEQGHFAKECKNTTTKVMHRHEQYFRSQDSSAPSAAPKISFDYGHTATPAGNALWGSNAGPMTPKKSMLVHFSESLIQKGRHIGHADDMILTWRMAGHTEETLKALFMSTKPKNEVQLRLVFVKELAHVPAGQIPAALNVSDLLDETVSFFMNSPSKEIAGPVHSWPSSSSSFNYQQGPKSQLENLESALQNISSMERFKELDSSISEVTLSNPQLRNEYEGRLQTLEPLQEFIARKMRVMSSMFGISESYIFTVSSTIQKLIAHVGMCLFTLKRMFSAYGIESIEDALTEKLRPFSDSFPTGVSVEYIVSMVGDFLKEICH